MCDRIGHRYGVRPSSIVDPDGIMTPTEARTFDLMCLDVAASEVRRLSGQKDMMIFPTVAM